jgi:hypothetical protein
MALKIKRRLTPLDENQKRQRQIVVISVLVAVALFFGGYTIGKRNNPEPSNSVRANENADFSKKSQLSQVTSLGPSKFKYVIPTGFTKSKDGAVKAAVTYIESWPALLSAQDYDVANAINNITTPNSTDLKQQLAQNIQDIRTAFADAIAGQSYHQSVALKVKVNSSDSKNVSLTIWTMELWVSAGSIEPQSTFDLQDIKLTYVDNDWKISNWTTSPGPTPEWEYRDEPLNSVNFLGSLSQFEEYRR